VRPRVYQVHDGGYVPDLRRRPLSTRVKVAAATLGAIGSLGGYTLGVGKWAVAHVEEAVRSVVRSEAAPIVKAQQEADRLAAEQFAAIRAEQAETRAAIQKLTEAVTKRRR